MLHCDKDCLYMEIIHWGFSVNPLGLLFLLVYNINQLSLLFCTQPCFIMMLVVVNHGPTSNYDKDYLNMKINNGQSCLS